MEALRLTLTFERRSLQVPFASCKRELLAAKQREWAPPRPGSGFRTTQRDASLGVQDYTIEKRINCRYAFSFCWVSLTLTSWHMLWGPFEQNNVKMSGI